MFQRGDFVITPHGRGWVRTPGRSLAVVTPTNGERPRAYLNSELQLVTTRLPRGAVKPAPAVPMNRRALRELS